MSIRPARNSVIDIIRGGAMLGILKMNLLDFGIVSGLERQSALAGWGSLATWWVDLLFVEGRFRTLFCMLFGASLLLFGSSRDQDGGRVAELWIRRCLWLVAFGIAHAYALLWQGDILYSLGLVGLVLLPFRSLKPRAIALLVVGWLAVSAGLNWIDFREGREVYLQGKALARMEATGQELTDEQREILTEYRGQKQRIHTTAEEATQEIRQRRGGYGANFELSFESALKEHRILPYDTGMLALFFAMLAGIGLFKAGILSGERSSRFYAKLALATYGIALPAQAVIGYHSVGEGLHPIGPWTGQVQPALFEALCYLSALGHLSVFVLLARSRRWDWLTSRLSDVGRLALSNYLLQTVLCSLLFYGFGLGWFGNLTRVELLAPLLLVWAVELIVSPFWLRHFQYGPAEWLWRSLTRWHREPFLRNATRSLYPSDSPAPAPAGS